MFLDTGASVVNILYNYIGTPKLDTADKTIINDINGKSCFGDKSFKTKVSNISITETKMEFLNRSCFKQAVSLLIINIILSD